MTGESVQPRPLQDLHVPQLAAHVAGDDAGRLARAPSVASRLAIEFDDAAVFLQAGRSGLVDEEMRVVLDGHGRGGYARRGGAIRDGNHSPAGGADGTPET